MTFKSHFKKAKLTTAALLLASLSMAARAEWPEKTVRIVVPFAAGAFTDIAARTLAGQLSKQFGQPFVVENKGGAGGTIGAAQVAKAEPDGYTLLVTDNSFVMSPSLYAKLPYNASKDIAQISQIAEAPSMLVGRLGLPGGDLKGFVAAAKKEPEKFNFGSGGVGSSAHLANEMLMMEAGIKLTHVPFKGVIASINEVVAGRIDVSMASVASGVAQVKAGRMVGLGVSGDKRNPLLPEVPTFKEQGFPGYSMSYWWGIAAPGATPRAVIDKLNQAIGVASASPELLKVYSAVGAAAVTSTPDAMNRKVEEEIQTWHGIIEKAQVKIN